MSTRFYLPVPQDTPTAGGYADRMELTSQSAVAFMGNLKSNADVILRTTASLLSARFPGLHTLFSDKASCSTGALDASFLEVQEQCQFAVVALGD